jgi:hypothetical protein
MLRNQEGDFFSQLEMEKEQAFNELDLKAEDVVIHPRFGKGKVKEVNKKKKINETYIDIDFEVHGNKKVLFIFARLKKL